MADESRALEGGMEGTTNGNLEAQRKEQYGATASLLPRAARETQEGSEQRGTSPETAVNLKLILFGTIVVLLLGTVHIMRMLIKSRVIPSANCSFKPGGVCDQTNRSIAVQHGAVAADEPRCSAVGKDVLKEGGNAVDAAVATALCLGVVNPMASGIGGGAFILIRLANGSAEVIDCRETAPGGATRDMYKKDPNLALDGALAIGTPGELAGLHLAWKRHGTLPWPRLLEPAIQLADGGFAVHPYLAKSISGSLAKLKKYDGTREVFVPNGKPLRKGDRCYRKRLAKTLRLVAEAGTADVLYQGDLAKQLAADVQAQGGLLTAEDLVGYQPQIRPVLEAEAFGYTLLGVPPPSSGGATVIEILKILSDFAMPLAGDGALGIHRMIEAFRHAYAVRMNLGDPAFVNTTAVVADMLSDDFNRELRSSINDEHTLLPTEYGGKWNRLRDMPPDHGTSHLSVVDSWRNAVALTTTVNTPFGSKILSPSTGILLNNEMADFSTPGVTGANGSPPSEANFIAPGKRPLSSMSPTIVLQGGQLRAVIGGSGGTFIITVVAQVFLNLFARGMDALSAIYSPRIHDQLIPNMLFVENQTLVNGAHVQVDEEEMKALQRRGHVVFPLPYGAVCQFIVQALDNPVQTSLETTANGVFAGELTAVSDPRKDGGPAGW